jgi:hypothetical protein
MYAGRQLLSVIANMILMPLRSAWRRRPCDREREALLLPPDLRFKGERTRVGTRGRETGKSTHFYFRSTPPIPSSILFLPSIVVNITFPFA